MNGFWRISILLTLEEMKALERLAGIEVRDRRLQARAIIHAELVRRGLLPKESGSVVAEVQHAPER